MKKKRLDLQAIRGIAILAVLLFHFFPDYFPNGYIGVDQFFVLSGYLIAMILNPSEIDFGTIQTFYYRRVKRIVPLYILIIFLVLISVFTVFPQTNIDLNVESAQYAMTFITNYQGMSSKRQYTVMLHSAVDAFTHTWSLAVEMQFYLLVPFIFYLTNKFGSSIILVVGAYSFMYSMSTCQNTAFNSVFARLWQFSVGIGSFLLTDSTEKSPNVEKVALLTSDPESFEEPSEVSSSEIRNGKLMTGFTYLVLALLVLQEFCPLSIYPAILRPLTTILTGALIMLGSDDAIWPMSSSLLVYLGDISYSLYLVHWPIYTYVKLTYPDDFQALCLALLAAIVLAVVLTETYEKFYLQLEKCSICLLLGILYILCVLLLLKLSHTDFEYLASAQHSYVNITREDAMKLNLQWDANDLVQLNPKNCTWVDRLCELKRNDNKTVYGPSILLLGNSYSGNIAETVFESCSNKASRITMYWAMACEMLVSNAWKTCKDATTDGFLKIVKREKPDILFLIVRHQTMMDPLDANVSVMEDAIYKKAKTRLDRFEALIPDTIYVLDAMPRPSVKIINILNKDLRANVTTEMSMLKGKCDEQNAKTRLAELVKNCKKCKMIDYSPYLTIDGEYQFYEKSSGLSHFTNNLHLTPLALRKVKPLFENICRNF